MPSPPLRGAPFDHNECMMSGIRKLNARLACALAVGVLMAASVSACSGGLPWEAPPCMPPQYSVTPSSAKPGDSVTVSAPDATCDPRYGANAQVAVILTDSAGAVVLQELAPMNDAGGFRFEFEVPAASAAGAEVVTAVPHGLDWCDDTGRNNRVAHNGDFETASCVLPMQTLTILP